MLFSHISSPGPGFTHKPYLCGLQRWTLETYDKAKKKLKNLFIMAGGDTTIMTFCMKLFTVCSNYLQLESHENDRATGKQLAFSGGTSK